jgi:hypothetical protein
MESVMPKTMLPVDLQASNEYYYSRKHIDNYISKAMLGNPDMVSKIDDGVSRLNEWSNKSYYPSKDKRLAQLTGLDFRNLVIDIFIGIAYCQIPETFVSVTSQLASRLNFDDKADSITTVAEMVAVLCLTDAFDIVKADRSARLMIQSRIPLPDELIQMVNRSLYLPPMVCEPNAVTSNYENGFLTHNDCLILGKSNHHGGDLCLDVINLQNKIELKLDTDFLSSVPEEPTYELDTPEKQFLWAQFLSQSKAIYELLIKQGNHFWLTNKVDKRGRLYSCGYHVNAQGTAYKKASIEFYHEELVTGVT